MRFAILLLFVAAPVRAADPQARVKVELSPADGAWVGQRVTLAITIYTPDFFAGVPSFDVPPIPGAVVLPPAGSPVIGSETIDGASFTTQRHEFAIYAQRAETVRVPAFPIRFESNAGFGKPTVRREVKTDAVSFTAKAPPGAQGLGTVIAARDLTVKDVWDPEPKAAKVGDAFTRTITVTAADVPGMVFPPFRLEGIAGLSAYPKAPAVNDRTDRGSLTGERTETVTYVCDEAGTVTVPPRTLTWYDLDTRGLKSVELPGRTFTVTDVPKPEGSAPAGAATTSPARSGRWRFVLAGTVVLAVVCALVVRLWRWGARRFAEYRESEPAHFARFRRACHSDDPHEVFVALLAWLDRFGPMSPDEFARRANDPELTGAVAALADRVYARPGIRAGSWDARQLFARIETARCKLQFPTNRPGAGLLPPLNPVG